MDKNLGETIERYSQVAQHLADIWTMAQFSLRVEVVVDLAQPDDESGLLASLVHALESARLVSEFPVESLEIEKNTAVVADPFEGISAGKARGLEDKNCVVCGVAFKPSNRNNTRCPDCVKHGRSVKKKARAKENPAEKSDPDPASLPTCPYCGVKFRRHNGMQKCCGNAACIAEKNRQLRANYKQRIQAKVGHAVEEPVEEPVEAVDGKPVLFLQDDPGGENRFRLWNGLDLTQRQMDGLLATEQLPTGTLLWEISRGWMIVSPAGGLRETELTEISHSMLVEMKRG